MWTTFSPFPHYSYVWPSSQCVNHSCNDESFPAIPNMPGFHWTKVVRAPAMLQLGLWPRCYQCYVNCNICYNVQLIVCKCCLQTTSFSVFIEFFSSLSSKHNWRHNRHNHSRRRREWPPSAPHEALRSALTLLIDGRHPPEIADVVLGGLRVCMPLKVLLCSGDDESPQHRSVLRATHTLNNLKKYIRLLGGLSPIHSMRRRGEKGLMWGTRGPYPPVSAMVGYGCVGRCWQLEANVTQVDLLQEQQQLSTEVFFLFLRRSHIFLTSDPAAK